MRASVVLLTLLLAACKDKPAPAPTPPAKPIDAAIDAPATGWIDDCATALKAAPGVTPIRRVMTIIEGCRACDGADWRPLLDWNTPAPEGPARTAIEATMAACGFCDPNAKQRFLGTLDDARGKPSRAPWRHLGEVCGEQVSAVPDARYMSAPYFALDRIARAAATKPELAPLLAGIEVPLPPVSLTSVGVELPSAAVMQPRIGPVHVTVIAGQIRIGVLPRATLGANGVRLATGGDAYPGKEVKLAELRAAVTKLVAETAPIPDARPDDANIAIFAPAESKAAELLPILAALDGQRVVLAVKSLGAPVGWELPGALPVVLDTKPEAGATRIELTDATTVDALVAQHKDQKTITGKPTIALASKTAKVAQLAAALGMVGFKGASGAAIVGVK